MKKSDSGEKILESRTGPNCDEATARAPASVGNIAVGFDILGHVLSGVSDEVQVRRNHAQEGAQVQIESISFADSLTPASLPLDPEKNTAGQAVLSLLKAHAASFSVTLKIHKGIPLSAGMGGSAASAVAAVMAANQLLARPLPLRDLLPFAVAGEAVASGAAHADNIAPCLLGGAQLIVGQSAYALPVDPQILCVVVHPDLKIETKTARAVLRPEVPLRQFTEQASYLAGFVHACHTRDRHLLRQVLRDICIEPQRAHLIPGFHRAQAEALRLGALGFSISGAGPSVFAWVEEQETAEVVRDATKKIFAEIGIKSEAWISAVASPGAHLISAPPAGAPLASEF